MINHVLLELFCTKKYDSNKKDNIACVLECPTYECLFNKCKYCAFTSHENALCYVNNEGNATKIISLGDEMVPFRVDELQAKKLWEKVSHEAIEKAYEKYIEELAKKAQNTEN